MVLCSECRDIFGQPDAYKKISSPAGLEFTRSPNNILSTAVEGCSLCRELLFNGNKRGAAVDDTLPEWPINEWRAAIEQIQAQILPQPLPQPRPRHRSRFSTFFRRRNNSSDSSSLDPRGPFDLTFNIKQHESGEGLIQIFRTHSEDERLLNHSLSSFAVGAYELSACTDDLAAKTIHHKLPNRDVRSDATYSSIRHWLSECDQDHPLCQNKGGNRDSRRIRPTRLLKLSLLEITPETVQLSQVEDEVVAYTALSYCWGAGQPNKLTTTNIDSYLRGIDLTSLPQSIQDAIEVTRKIGLEYLWVDAMCILQDSEDDQAHEIARMQFIYTNAYITISASCAETCNDGFLSPRDPSPNLREVSIPFCNEEGEMGVVTLTPVNNPDGVHLDHSLRPEPMNSRAWCMQESFMSPRMLIYSSTQLFWLCPLTWGKDGGRISKAMYFKSAIKLAYSADIPPTDLSLRSLSSPITSDWIGIVREYTLRDITKSSDKLPALSSLAAYFSERLQDQYLAGLWMKTLRENLCWFCDKASNSQAFGPGREWLRRPVDWRAPSWSFLAIDGCVDFKRDNGTSVSYDPFKGSDQCPECVILSCEVKPKDPQVPFGQVLKYGTLKVRGRFLEVRAGKWVKLVENEENTWGPIWYVGGDLDIILHFDTWQEDESHYWGRVIKTAHGNLDRWTPLFLLFIFQRRFSQYEFRSWGLNLVKLPNGKYHRVGYFEGQDEFPMQFMHNGITREVEII